MAKKKKNQRSKIREVANRLVKELGELGFTIQRYNAHGTNSVYLKLDYGMSHSIRISDHEGYGHLKYRYNVLTNWDRKNPTTTMDDGFVRFYYNTSDWLITALIESIANMRSAMIIAYGIEDYKKMMDERLQSNEGARGFWAQSTLVHEGEPRMIGHEEMSKLNEGVLKW